MPLPAAAVPVAGDGVLLRPWEPAGDDVDVALEAAVDELVSLWNAQVSLTGDLDAAAAATAWCAQRADWSDGSHASWAVTVPDRPAVALGGISVHQVDAAQGTARIGYWLLARARGTGLAAKALVAATAFSFEVGELHRIELVHAVDNVASCRTALRAGYMVEGTHRQSYRYGDGARHDEHTHARLRTDQPA